MILDEYHIKNYLSYSQFKLFKQGEEAYRKVYLFGYHYRNKYTDFGSKVHEALATRKSFDRDTKLALDILPKTQAGEVESYAKLNGVPLYGKLDGLNIFKRYYHIVEYKTGKNRWTQSKVDRDKQLLFYAILISAGKKIPVEEVRLKLIWLETFEDTDGSMHLTGKTETLRTSRNQDDIDKIAPEIKEVWKGIGKMMAESIKGR